MVELRLLRFASAATVVSLAAAEFKAQEFLSHTVVCNTSLTTKVANTCRGNVFKDAQFEVWAKNLDFSFGRLSEADWEAVKQQYTVPWAGPEILSGKTELFEAYNSQKEYNLLDFLPLTLRGLVDYCFIEEDEPLPKDQPLPDIHTYKNTIIVPNCWATVYETMRMITRTRQDDINIFHDIYSTDDKAATAWADQSLVELPGPYRNVERQFGDVMLIYMDDKAMKRPVLEHAVFFIDNDIIWEKAGTGDLNPFRLTDISTVEREWKPSSMGGFYSWHAMRPTFHPDQSKTFSEEFSLMAQREDARWPQFWTWPEELKRVLSLGVADNPRNLTQIDELTLLKSRKYEFCKTDSRWTPCKPKLEEPFVI